MDVTDVVEQKQKPESTPESRKAARERQRTHRAKVAQEEVQSERDQRSEESWRSRRHELKVISLFETEPDVFCKDVAEQLQICREFARRLIVRPHLQTGDTYKSYFQRVLETWCSPRWRCAGRSIARDEIVYSVRFAYRKEDIEQLLQEMLTGVDPDEQINVAELETLRWTVLPARAVQPVDEKIQRSHDGHDQQVREQEAVKRGAFSIADAGVNFVLQPDGSEFAWTYPRSWPPAQVHINWNLLTLAARYFATHPDDPRHCPEVRDRVSRVLSYRAQQVKTNYHGIEEDK